MPAQKFKTEKSAATFARVLRTATRLFTEKGFERTTMRDISRESALGLGALYYYFRSKEELILLFYEQINQRILAAYRAQTDRPRHLPEAFAAFLRLKLELLAPHRDLLRIVIKEAVDPASPLSPTSTESSRALGTSLALLTEMLAETKTVKARDAERLARLLWLVHMGVLAYWLHDRSQEQAATGRLIDTCAQGLKWSTLLGRIPGTGRLRTRLLAHAAGLFPDAGITDGPAATRATP